MTRELPPVGAVWQAEGWLADEADDAVGAGEVRGTLAGCALPHAAAKISVHPSAAENARLMSTSH